MSKNKGGFDKWCRNNWTHASKTRNLDPDLTLFTEMNSSWTTGLNVKCKMRKLLEDNTGKKPDDLGYGEDLRTNTKAQSMKKITDTLDFIKIKNFHSVKDKVKGMRRQATDWEKLVAKDTCGKGPSSKIFKAPNKKTTQLKNGPRTTPGADKAAEQQGLSATAGATDTVRALRKVDS